jgi:PhzF family phenazine biosynthesis protein
MKVTVYTLDSFAKKLGGGNPAGVVLRADDYSEKEMRLIAKEVGFSETAFVMNSDNADFKIRFFTPNEEVDLCGHATIGAFSLMLDKSIITSYNYTQETKAGILGVAVTKDKIVFMDQNIPEFFNILDKAEIAESLNISVDDMIEELPVRIVSTGLKDIFIPIRDIETLNKIKPNFGLIKTISKKWDVTGYHVFTLETLNNSTAYCRNFAPLYDIDEESATGTSNGALSCYLYKYGRLVNSNINNLIFEQGYSMGKPSEIRASLSVEDKEIVKVKVGGSALNIKSINVNI